jgi:PAS domain-containing protein
MVEDPLLAALTPEVEWVQIVDSGSLMNEEFRLVSCDVVFAVPPIAANRAARIVIAEVEKLGITRGSSVTVKGLESQPVGRMSGLRVRLPEIVEVEGEDHEHVFVNADLTRLVGLVEVGLGDRGVVWSWRIRDDLASDITIHGRDALAMEERVRQILEPEPAARGMSFERFA